MALSRRELLRDQLVREFQKISEENGYRTTPQRVLSHMRMFDQVKDFPTVCISVGDERLVWRDDNRNVYDSYIEVEVRGYYSDETEAADEDVYAAETAGEPLLHDMKKVLHALRLINVTNTTERWIVSGEYPLNVIGPKYIDARRGFVGLRFIVQIGAQTGTFS